MEDSNINEEQKGSYDTSENSFFKKLESALGVQKNKKLNYEFKNKNLEFNATNNILIVETGCGKSTLINAIFANLGNGNNNFEIKYNLSATNIFT